MIYGTLLVSIYGLIIGSFLNVVAIRVLKKESIAYPPSHCVHCNHQLKPWDMVPVFSYLFLRGKCRYCRQPISIRYPLGEMATALLFVAAYWVIGFNLELIVALFFISILVVITQTDLQAMRIPNAVVVVAVAGAIGLRLWIHPLPLWDYLSAMFVGSGLLLAIGLVSGWILKRETMGAGDVKLYVFIGLILGIKLTVFSLFAASVIGLIIGLVQRMRGRHEKYAEVPFGPSIALGSLFVYFFGEHILDWYLGYF
jgi:leader peptidase (prepilin peptidase) / N-methyltransferase